MTDPSAKRRIVLRVYQAHDQQLFKGLQQLRRQATVPCRSGCGYCCSEVASALPIEAEVAVAQARKSGYPVEARALAWRDAAIAAGVHDPDPNPAVYFAAQLPCPFLDNGSCAVYDWRPASCRAHTVVGADTAEEWCRKPHAERGSDRRILFPPAHNAAVAEMERAGFDTKSPAHFAYLVAEEALR